MVQLIGLSGDLWMDLWGVISIGLFSLLLFLFVVYLVSLFNRRVIHGRFTPRVTILVPAFNEEKSILNCLRGLGRLDYPSSKVDVVVVDDGSTDGTGRLVRTEAKKSNLRIRSLRVSHRGKSEALNAAVERITSPFILVVDADISLQSSTLKEMLRPLSKANVSATNAVITINSGSGLLNAFQRIEFSLMNLIRTSFSRVFKNSVWFYGAVACYRRSHLKRVGGFKRDSLTEDMDICLELYRRGGRIVTCYDARAFTVAMPSIWQLARQRMRWYYGALQALWKSKSLFISHRHSPAVLFLFVNQWWWTLFAFLFFPFTAYAVWFWFPGTSSEAFLYLVRWFSLWGPFYVVQHIPEWGVNFINIFGVLSGFITLFMSLAALGHFARSWSWWIPVALLFYFPYTILLNAILIAGIFRYMFAREKFFKE